jgi:dTDP-4-dehydrorhamnose reductase
MRASLLVLGAGGQVAKALLEAAPGQVIGLTHAELDICCETAVGEALRRIKPAAVINAAAYTAVDRAESEPEAAFRANFEGARIVAQSAAAADVPLIHLSTDYVFDGNSRAPYTESDTIHPLSVYGRSKEEGEGAVRNTVPRHVILRSSWIFSPFGANFVRTMLRLGAERTDLRVVDDQVGCPTSAADIATAILTIIYSCGRQDFLDWGTYHYVGADAVTWYGFAKIIFDEAKAIGRPAPHLEPITTAQYPTPALRPAYSVLNTEKFRRTFGLEPRPLRESLADCLARLFQS